MESTRIFLSDFRFRVDETNLSVRSQQLQARLKLYPGMLLSQIVAQDGFVWIMRKVTGVS